MDFPETPTDFPEIKLHVSILAENDGLTCDPQDFETPSIEPLVPPVDPSNQIY